MAQAMRKPTACHSSKLRCRLRGAYLAYALVPLYESPTIRSEVAAGSQRMPLTDDKNNEEHSIGSARRLKLHQWKKSIRRALPIEFVELSRDVSYGY